MYISDTENAVKRSIICYGAAALFCLVFGLIYEHFSHGVTSWYMVLAFLIPLAGGVTSALSYSITSEKSGNLFRQLICGSTIWFTLGSLFKGVLEIYGTTNRLIVVFAVAGILQLAAAVIALLFQRKAS